MVDKHDRMERLPWWNTQIRNQCCQRANVELQDQRARPNSANFAQSWQIFCYSVRTESWHSFINLMSELDAIPPSRKTVWQPKSCIDGFSWRLCMLHISHMYHRILPLSLASSPHTVQAVALTHAMGWKVAAETQISHHRQISCHNSKSRWARLIQHIHSNQFKSGNLNKTFSNITTSKHCLSHTLGIIPYSNQKSTQNNPTQQP